MENGKKKREKTWQRREQKTLLRRETFCSLFKAMRLMDTLNKLYNSEEERKKEEKVDQRGGCRPRGGGGDKRRGGGNSRVGQWGIGEISDRATVRRLRGDGDIELQIRKRRTWVTASIVK